MLNSSQLTQVFGVVAKATGVHPYEGDEGYRQEVISYFIRFKLNHRFRKFEKVFPDFKNFTHKRKRRFRDNGHIAMMDYLHSPFDMVRYLNFHNRLHKGTSKRLFDPIDEQ